MPALIVISLFAVRVKVALVPRDLLIAALSKISPTPVTALPT